MTERPISIMYSNTYTVDEYASSFSYRCRLCTDVIVVSRGANVAGEALLGIHLAEHALKGDRYPQVTHSSDDVSTNAHASTEQWPHRSETIRELERWIKKARNEYNDSRHCDSWEALDVLLNEVREMMVQGMFPWEGDDDRD